MCGITGIINFNNNLKEYKYYKKFCESLEHRGKDDEGYVLINNHNNLIKQLSGKHSVNGLSFPSIENENIKKYSILLHHNRLSIIDLSLNGHQPMEYNGRWIIFNGEIFNYIELRKKLISIGYSFNTESDTEVILKGFDYWGENIFQKMNGQWAIPLIVFNNRNIYLCRDRFGIKPLYYIESNNDIYFSSELKSFFNLKDKNFTINDYEVFKYLVYGKVNDSEETFVKEIKQINPSHYIKINLKNKDIKQIRYYNLKEKNIFTIKNECEALELFNDLFLNSIKLRLRSDIPVGSCLSGGLDSSSIVYTIKNNFIKVNPFTFSAIFKGFKYDESIYINELKNQLDLNNYKISINKGSLKNEIVELIKTQDQPFLSLSVFGQFKVMQLAGKHNIHVLLDGQGGDEVLGGYGKYYTPGALENIAFNFIFNKQNINNFLISKIPILISMPNTQNKYCISPQFFNKYKNKYLNEQYNYYKSIKNIRPFQREIIKTMEKDILPQLLHYVDRNAMNFTIEGRYPFLDHNLVEGMMSISGNIHRKNNISKFLLRKYMNNKLPNSIVNNYNKNGFFVPQENWIVYLYDIIIKHFRNIPEYFNSIIEPEYFEYLINRINSDNINYNLSLDIWKIFNLIYWYEIHFGKKEM